MAIESLLTSRDVKAIASLLNQAIDKLPDNPAQAELWRSVLRRFQGDANARPQSLAPSLAALISAARSSDITEVDRLAKNLAEGLFRHGDLEGSAALKRLAESVYERPQALKPPAKGGQSASGSTLLPSPPKGGAGPAATSPRPTKEADSCIKWYAPEDLSEEMVLDATTGPQLRRLVSELEARSGLIAVGIDAPTRIVFHGPPGTGKTLGARWLGGSLRLPVAAAKIGGMLSSYVGATTQNLMRVFEGAVAEGAIIFLDEIESISGNRSDGPNGAHDEYKRLTGALLQALDQLPPQQIVIAATNYRNRLDAALAERLGFEVAFAFPDEVARTAQVNRHWRHIRADMIAAAYLVQATGDKSGRFIRWAAHAAARAAISSAREANPRLPVEEAIKVATVGLNHVEPALAQARRAEEEAAAAVDAVNTRPRRA